MRRILIILLVSILYPSSFVRASFEEVEAGARTQSLGGAFTAIANDVYALNYNPAGLEQIQRKEIAIPESDQRLGKAVDRLVVVRVFFHLGCE